VISDFRHEVYQICARLGYYAACSGTSLPTFRDNLSAPSSKKLSDPCSKRWDRQTVSRDRYGITTIRRVTSQKNAYLVPGLIVICMLHNEIWFKWPFRTLHSRLCVSKCWSNETTAKCNKKKYMHNVRVSGRSRSLCCRRKQY